MPAYRQNLIRLGYGEDDLGRVPSDRVVDALVACGDVEAIRERVAAHLDAGADHVCVEVLTGDDTTVPMAAWRELAPALTAL
jgi:2-methylisocitrate lyase-like PEP mutase family enzyme